MVSFHPGGRSLQGRADRLFHDAPGCEDTVSAGDLDLLQVFDTPQQVVTAIFDYYERKDFEPFLHEQDKLLEL